MVDRRCGRASRQRALPVQGDSVGVSLICYREAAQLAHRNGDASVEAGIEWLLQTVGLLGVPWPAALGVPQDRDDEIVARARTARD